MKGKSRSRSEFVADLNDTIQRAIPESGLRILEAGCGSLSHIHFPEGSHVTGIDISQEQLAKSTTLDEKILDDLQSHKFESNKYHLIVCWDVLEHLDNPKLALLNLVPALKLGGIILIKVPNMESLKGVITKYTPHWFHVFWYKYVMGHSDAGQPGCAPFPTIMERTISPSRLRSFFEKQNLELLSFEQYDGLPYALRKEKTYLKFIYYLCADLLGFLTFKKLGGRDNTDFACIYRKAN